MNIDHFGFLAPVYDRVIQYRDAETMIEKAGLPTGGILLDVGGGTGRVAAALQAHVSRILVLDVSRKMLARAARKNLVASCGASEGLPFPSNRFERVILVDALHHVEDQQATVSEMVRVLAPGGRLVIVEPDITCFWVKLIALFEKATLMRSHFLSPQEMLELFSGRGSKPDLYRQNCNAWLALEKSTTG
ncbi:MAG: methyltransferase domain-containing protein [Chloroflexi bacterium]|nr:methyltransferase domain-containing protein [Chloroflexota bacterium]